MTNSGIKKICLHTYAEFEPIEIDELKIEFEKRNEIDEVNEESEDRLLRDYIIKDYDTRIKIIESYKIMLKNIKEYDYIFHLIWTYVKNNNVFQLWIIMRYLYLEKIAKNDIEIFIDCCLDKRNVHEFLRKYLLMGEYGFSPMRCVIYGQLQELWI